MAFTQAGAAVIVSRCGASCQGQNRTADTQILSPLLYDATYAVL